MFNRRNLFLGTALLLLPKPSFAIEKSPLVKIDEWKLYEPEDGMYPRFDWLVNSFVERGSEITATSWGLWRNVDHGRNDLMFVYAKKVRSDEPGSFISKYTQRFPSDETLRRSYGNFDRSLLRIFKDGRVHAPEREWASHVIEDMRLGEGDFSKSSFNAIERLIGLVYV